MGSFFSVPDCDPKKLCPSKFRGTPDCNESAALHSYGLDAHCRPVLRNPTTGQGIEDEHTPGCRQWNTTATCVDEPLCKWGMLPKGSGWWIGVLMGLFSSAATCFGLILQKCAHVKNLERPPEKRAYEINGIPLTWWWFGSFCLMVLVPLPFDFVAFSFASQSLLVPLAGVTLVMNQIFAPCLLGEKLYRIDIYATVIILVGCTMTTATGNHEETTFTACDFLDMYLSARFLCAELVVLWPLMVFCVINVKRPSWCGLPFAKPEWDEFFGKLKWLHPVFYAFVAAGFGCQQNVVFKVTGELTKDSVQGSGGGDEKGPWSYVFPYIHVVLIVFFASAQIMWINKGIHLFDAVLSLPLYNSFYIVLSGTWGFIYFDEMAKFDTFQWVMFPLGIAITIGGILLMTSKREKGVEAEPQVHPLGKVRLQLVDVDSSGSEGSEGGAGNRERSGSMTRDFATSPIHTPRGGWDEDSSKAPKVMYVSGADAGAGPGPAAGNGGNPRRVIPVGGDGDGDGDGEIGEDSSGGGRMTSKINRQNTWMSSTKHAQVTPKNDTAAPVWLSSRDSAGGNLTLEEQQELRERAEAAAAAAAAGPKEGAPEVTAAASASAPEATGSADEPPTTPKRPRSPVGKKSASAESLRSAEDSSGSGGSNDDNGHSSSLSTTLTLSPGTPAQPEAGSAAAAASALVEAAIRDGATPR